MAGQPVDGRSVVLALDRERRLRYDINAICDLENVLGLALGEALAPGRIGFVALRACIWAGLRREDPALTLTQAGDLIQGHLDNGGSIQKLADTMHEALRLAGLAGKADGAGDAADAAPFPSAAGSTTPSV